MATFNINDVARRVQYTVGSSNRAGPYNFSFQVNAASELQVYQNDTLLTDSVQYSATVSSTAGTGSITFIDNSGSGGTNYTPAQNDIVTIIGDQPLSRTTVFQTGSANNPVTLETEFDNVVIRQQQLKEMMDRSIQLKPSTTRTVTGTGTSGPLQFPYDATVSNNADKVIAYDTNGTSLTLGPTVAGLTTLTSIATEVQTLAGISSDITTVAGMETNISSIISNQTNINTVANSITNVNTTATNISSVNTVATDITNVNQLANALNLETTFVVTVANPGSGNVFVIDGSNNPTLTFDRGATYIFDLSNSSNAGHPLAFKDGSGNAYTTGVTTTGTAGTSGAKVTIDVASNAPSSLRYYCTVHGNAMGNTISVVNNNLNTVAGNITSINTVASDIANVNTTATNIANVNSVAGNETNINAVNSNSSNITTVAGSITNVNNVGGSITNVNTVASNLSDVNNFAETYRISATAPTTSLNIGDLWFDTTNNVMKVYASSGWITAASAVNGTAQRYQYTATANQTTFTGADDNSNTLAYDAGFVDIYLNGIKLVSGGSNDYVATNGTSVVLNSGASVNDILQVVAYGTFELANFSINAANDVNTTGLATNDLLRYDGTNFVPKSFDEITPTQTSNAGKFLTTDGTNSSWGTVNTNLVADTTPQLGGDLDGNGNTIDLSASTTELRLPRGTTAQQPTPSAANEGAIRYDTDDNVVYYSDGSSWIKVSSVQATLSSVTGNIIAGLASTLTLAGTGFMASNLVVNFLQSSDSINVNVTVTPTSDTAATVAVPSSVYSNVTAGNVVTIKVTNSDGLSSGNQTITAGSLPTGGTISTSGNYRIHKFTSSGTFAVGTVNPTVDILLLAGGGGGGAGNSSSTHSAGGGGAGGMFTSTSQSTSANTNYTVTIGSGGAGNTNAGDQGANGGNTTFTGQTNAVGGGGGGTRQSTSGTSEHPGNDGGSGGGSCPETGTGQAGGSGTSGQGNDGGTADRNIGRAGAGGGGKGSVGGIGQNHTGGDGNSYNGGAGGSGATNDYTGSSITYAAGGGGGAANIGGPHGTAGASGHPANGGAGGSGTGSAANGNAGNANTGQGGGGGASGHPVSAIATGGNGGSGILVVRYDTTTL